jgi:hypothetical protein
MKLTNKHGIPDTFLNVLKRPTYSKGRAHLSATQLLNSPKIVALTKKFEDELEQDVSDMGLVALWHGHPRGLEHGKDDNHIVEERLTPPLMAGESQVPLTCKSSPARRLSPFETTRPPARGL